MQYAPYYRPVNGAKTAVLFVHGIVGTPAHFQDMLPVVPEDWSLYNILLDGHGGSVLDFARTSMQKWKAQVSDQLDQILQSHSQVLIVAHSMGTLFAIHEAIQRPEQIKALFLLAVPLAPHVPPSTALYSTMAALGPKPGSRAAIFQKACGVRLSPFLPLYLSWLPRFLELFSQIRKTIRILPLLKTPTHTFQSYTDELVGRKAIRYLENHPSIKNTVLFGSGHFSYNTADTRLLQTRLKDIIQSIK